MLLSMTETNWTPSLMGHKGGQNGRGQSKARPGQAAKMRAWWASEASKPYRSKKKPSPKKLASPKIGPEIFEKP